MNPKELLGLPEGPLDLATLRRAYAAQLRLHRPDTDPEGFQRVRGAYEILLAWLGNTTVVQRRDVGTGGDPVASWSVVAERRTSRPGNDLHPASAMEPDLEWTADAVLAAWHRGESSSALRGVEALAGAGDLEQVERLALQTLEDPQLPSSSDMAPLAIAVARMAALVRPDLALRLADAAWRASSPQVRRRLDTHSVDLWRRAAEDMRLWSPSERSIVLRVAAGVTPPPAPMSADWDRALKRIGRLPPESPLLALIAANAPEVLTASGAKYFAGRAPRPPRRRQLMRKSLPVIVALWILVSGVAGLVTRHPALKPQLPYRSFLRQHPELFIDRVPLPVGDRTERTDLDLLAKALRSLDTTPPPDPERARALLDELVDDPRFGSLIRNSNEAATLYVEARLKHVPVGESMDEMLLRLTKRVPR